MSGFMDIAPIVSGCYQDRSCPEIFKGDPSTSQCEFRLMMGHPSQVRLILALYGHSAVVSSCFELLLLKSESDRDSQY